MFAAVVVVERKEAGCWIDRESTCRETLNVCNQLTSKAVFQLKHVKDLQTVRWSSDRFCPRWLAKRKLCSFRSWQSRRAGDTDRRESVQWILREQRKDPGWSTRTLFPLLRSSYVRRNFSRRLWRLLVIISTWRILIHRAHERRQEL